MTIPTSPTSPTRATSQRFVRLLSKGAAIWARSEGNGEARRYVALSAAPWLPHEEQGAVTPEAFLAPATPTKIVCVGRNYAAHAKELGNEVPSVPLLFLKPPSAIIGPNGTIRRPAASERVEHEGELAAVIGQRLQDGTEADAQSAVFGWTTANDITARDLQRADGYFTRGKGFDTFCPVGPSIVTHLDVSDLRVRTYVGDTLRQNGRTSAMVHPPYRLISFIAHIMTLEPGDLVLTGTPAGVGPLEAGDDVRVEIDGLEPLHNTVE